MGLLNFFKKDKTDQIAKREVYDQYQSLNTLIQRFRDNEKEIRLKEIENNGYYDTINDIAGKIYTSEKIDTSIKRIRNEDIIFQLNQIREKKYTEWTIKEIEILEAHVIVIDDRNKSYREGIIDIFEEEDD